MGHPLGDEIAAEVRAIEANSAECLLAMGRAAGAEERSEPAIQWVIGGSPIAYHNCVVRADLPAHRVDELIAAAIERFRAHGVPGSWHVSPAMRPPDLGKRLEAHGFTYAGDDIGMAVNLAALSVQVSPPSGLVIERVREERKLEAWASILAQSFGEGVVEADWVKKTFRLIGLGNDVPWRHYLGIRAGEPVATATLFLGGGAAGIYFVATLPTARRQGIGTALTLAALRDGMALGPRIAVLGASPQGVAVYRRLGFHERCRIGLYEWHPAAP